MDQTIEITSWLQNLSRHKVQRDKGWVLSQEVAQRLMDRLAGIKIHPERILNITACSHILEPSLKQSFPQSQTTTLDLLSLPLPSLSFGCESKSVDLIISNLAFYWVDDLLALFQEIQRVLKPGGLLLFTTLGPDTLLPLRQAWQAVDDMPHVHHFWDLHDIGDALLYTSFADPVMDVERLTIEYGQLADLWQDLKSQGETNCLIARRKTLTGLRRWRAMLEQLDMLKAGQYQIPFEINYGQAWGVDFAKTKPNNDNAEVLVDVASIKKYKQ